MFNTPKLKGWALSACLLGLVATPPAWSADVIQFDADGPAPANGSMPVVAFDWIQSSNVMTAAPGSTTPAFPLLPGQSRSVQMLSHGVLNGFADINGNPAGSPAGLNTNFELTFVVGFGARVTNNNGTLSFGPIDTDPKFKQFVEVWYDQGPSVKSDALSGLGYAGGSTLILRGEVVDISQSPLPINGPLVTFDQFGANDFPGVQTPYGTGGMQLTARVIEANPAFFVNNSLPVGSTTLFFNQSLQNLFAQTNPSKSFVRGSVTDGHPTFNPVLGAINGQSGPDFQQQVDANNSFTAPLCTGQIGNFVWNDLNSNGLQNVGEPGFDGVQLVLRNAVTNALIGTTNTAGGGQYLFSGLCAGSYQVTVTEATLPAGFVPTTSFAGDTDLDNNGSPATVILPANNTQDLSIDFGYRQPPASLGDLVWNDLNRNGIQDGNEQGINGLTVQLFVCGADPNGAPLATKVTANGGLYLFDNLAPGSYFVKFALAAGYVFSPMDAGNDSLDSDANLATGVTDCVDLSPGETDLSVDAGMNRPAESSLGNYVWEDTNANGLQDDGNTGVPNVTVNLFNCDGTSAGKPAVLTDANGFYQFTGLSAGQYYVVFNLSTAAPGFVFTTQNVAGNSNEATDSDANPFTGKSEPCVTLGINEANNDVDAGVYQYAELGDRVWFDTNQNGLQDGGENGIANVAVNLLDCDNQTVMDTMLTNASGNYLFTDLVPGRYMVEFVNPNPGVLVFTSKDVGADDAVDSDADVTTGRTTSACIKLESGQSDLAWDAGLYEPLKPKIDIEKSTNDVDADNPNGTGIPQIAPGSKVTWTYTVKNTGNTALSNVTVTDDQPGVVVSCPKTSLAVGETMICTAIGMAVNLATDTTFTKVSGTCGGVPNSTLYENMGKATGKTFLGDVVQDTDPSHYCNPRTTTGAGTGTPGYWKNHPNAWPVSSITIGGVVYSKANAILWMGAKDGDKTVTMFRSLVSAKLNVLIGAESSCIASTITAADSWMKTYGPVGSKVDASSQAWKIGEPLYKKLDDYNNGLLCAPHRD